MQETHEKSCPDCGEVMHRIKIIDRGGRGVYASEHDVIGYAVPQARVSFWTGRFPVEGKLAAFMCQGCARVILYGVPNKDQ